VHSQEIACGLKGATHVMPCIHRAQENLMNKADNGGRRRSWWIAAIEEFAI
jgi:hypothetical protein